MLQGWLRSLCVLHPPAWQEQKHQKKDQCQKARPQSCVQREVNVSIPVQQNQSVVQLETIEHFERYCGVLGLVDLFIYLFFVIDTLFFRFDFNLSLEEATQRHLDLSVKNNGSFMSREKETIGRVWQWYFWYSVRQHDCECSIAFIQHVFERTN